MGGKLSSSGHAKTALVQLQIQTSPHNLSHNNSAGPLPVETGGNKTKREPWARALSGKNTWFQLGTTMLSPLGGLDT